MKLTVTSLNLSKALSLVKTIELLKYNKYPPVTAGGISFSGIALTILAAPQVRLELACQPCKGLLTTHKWVPWVKH